MKLYYDKRSKDPIYYAQEGIRNGKKVTTRTVKRLGKHSELLLICDDPLEYVKNEIKKMNEEKRGNKETIKFSIDLNEKVVPSNDVASRPNHLNIGYLYFKSIYKMIHIDDFFKTTFDNRQMDQINQFLMYTKILDPKSKLETNDHFHIYVGQPDFTNQQIYRYMELLYPYFNEYIEYLYRESSYIIPRDNSIIYYDFTYLNETNDEEYVDDVTGEVIKGFRQFEMGKDQKSDSLIETGLIMDQSGNPISMHVEIGNINEQTTPIPLENKLLEMHDNSRFIFVSDGNLDSYPFHKFNAMGGEKIIVSRSINDLSDDLKETIFNDINFKLLSNNRKISIEYMKSFNCFDPKNLALYNNIAYKIVNDVKSVVLGVDEINTKEKAKQKLIITFSRKMMKYQKTIRARKIQKVRELLEKNDLQEIMKAPDDIRRFMKRGAGDNYLIDVDQIKNEEKYDGYCCFITNLEGNVRDMIKLIERRNKIKAGFSDNLKFSDDPKIIKSHFLTCYTSLLLSRIMEAQIKKEQTMVTLDHLTQTIRNMNVIDVQGCYYMALYDNSYALQALENQYSLLLDRLYYRPKELNKRCEE